MRIVLQRVSSASVTVNEEVVGAIQNGLCLLIGINRKDTLDDAAKLIKKILKLRLWPEDDRGWRKNVVDLQGDILCVSQFTLYGNTEKGSKPDFHAAMKTEEAKALFNQTVQLVRDSYPNGVVQTGAFGELMKVNLVNDGPVTIIFDTGDKKKDAIENHDDE